MDESSRRNMREHGRFFLTHADQNHTRGLGRERERLDWREIFLLVSQLHIWRAGLDGGMMTGGEFFFFFGRQQTMIPHNFFFGYYYCMTMAFSGIFGKGFPLLFKRSEATEIVLSRMIPIGRMRMGE